MLSLVSNLFFRGCRVAVRGRAGRARVLESYLDPARYSAPGRRQFVPVIGIVVFLDRVTFARIIAGLVD